MKTAYTKQASGYHITSNGVSQLPPGEEERWLPVMRQALYENRERYKDRSSKLLHEPGLKLGNTNALDLPRNLLAKKEYDKALTAKVKQYHKARQATESKELGEKVARLLDAEWLRPYDAQWKIAVYRALTTPSIKKRSEYIKTASTSMGNATEAEFETALAQLSMLYLRDKAPKLFDYLIGFRVLDKSDDNTKAVGIFGFKIGREWIYVPSFFHNGELKGHELMYLYNKDQFKPLKENYVNEIIRNQPANLGEPDTLDVTQLKTRYPDMMQLAAPPPLGKAASVKTADHLLVETHLASLPEWLRYGVMSLSKLATISFNSPDMTAGDRLCDLEHLCSSNPRLFKKLAHAAYTCPAFKEALDKFYDTGMFQRVYDRLSEREKRATKVNNAANPPVNYRIEDYTPKKKVRVILDGDPDAKAMATFMGEDQVGRMIEGKPIVFDSRSDNEVAVIKKGDFRLRSPDRTGVYKVLMANGQIRECLVVIAPIGELKGKGRCLVADWKRQECIRTQTWAVHCVDEPFNEAWFDRLPADFKSPDALCKESDFNDVVFIGRDGTGTLPLSSRYNYRENAANGVFEIHLSYNNQAVDRATDADYPRHMFMVTQRQILTSMADKGMGDQHTDDSDFPSFLIARREIAGPKFIVRDDKLYLPRQFKYVQLSSASMALATENDIKEWIFSNTKILRGAKTATNRYSIDNRLSVDRSNAFRTLVENYNFREKTAEAIIDQWDKSAGRNIDIRYKQAADLSGRPNIMAPAFNEPPVGADSFVGVATQSPTQDTQTLGFEGEPQPMEQIPDEVPPPDPLAMQDAQDAAATGKKDVFDVSSLVGLLHDEQQDDLLRDYSKIFNQALDRLCRLLFKYYWDTEEFSDRFGEDKMQSLEDSIRSSIDKLGDLCLFVSEKDNRPSASDFMSSALLGLDAGGV